ncbi:hypothetical protein MTP06_53460 [Streptomyces sp. PLM4]|nr:hypothetical protein MTP06_53460 [Streptomyces sp. PLM4]
MAEAEPAGPTRVNAVAAASAMAVVRTVFIVLENTHSLSVVSVVPVGYGIDSAALSAHRARRH